LSVLASLLTRARLPPPPGGVAAGPVGSRRAIGVEDVGIVLVGITSLPTRTAVSGVDGLGVLPVAGDADLARLGAFGDRDAKGEHAGFVARSNMLSIKGFAEE
jgi:hypothetical protein